MQLDLSFFKYHGCGNDFIIIDELAREEIPETHRGKIAIMFCRRRYGIGADDVLYLTSTKKADSMLRIFEPDGSEAEMSGNGIRCAAAYLCNKLRRNEVLIDTNSGTKRVKRIGKLYRVNMGKPRITKSGIGKFLRIDATDDDKLLDRKLVFQGLGEVEVSVVNVGEPHAVIFVEDVGREDILGYGRAIANNREIFPYGINVDLVHILDEATFQIRTYERGVWDETMACGTGATAAAAVSHITGRVKRSKIKAIMKGGELIIEISGGSLFLIGAATKIYSGLTTLHLE